MPYSDNKTSTALYMRTYISLHNISDLLKKSCPSFVNLPVLGGFIEEDVSSYFHDKGFNDIYQMYFSFLSRTYY